MYKRNFLKKTKLNCFTRGVKRFKNTCTQVNREDDCWYFNREWILTTHLHIKFPRTNFQSKGVSKHTSNWYTVLVVLQNMSATQERRQVGHKIKYIKMQSQQKSKCISIKIHPIN